MKSKNMLATNATKESRQSEDFYATDPKALEIFLDALNQDGIELPQIVWECAVGMGHLADVLKRHVRTIHVSDIVERGYEGTRIKDFLQETRYGFNGTILTNPPFKLATQFVEKGMEILKDGNMLILFLKIQFLESKARRELFRKYPPKFIYVNSERQHTAKDGNFTKYNTSIGTLCFCWFVWEKGYKGEPTVRWV
ncbi:MAG: NAD(P)-dependent oxidoreductase [Firmicutes bacterium]|nr:NAD(P)-dependent oxidoreductase [Bacillota bacterium]